jgi:beta-xylosidase
VWIADNGDGTYTNPVLYADYSDPDVVRVGDDFYMTASSFNVAPGLPILHSKDLVNWRIIGHALQFVPPVDSFRTPQHGKGVWAPALRYRNGEFLIYYGDPDQGIYLVKAKRPEGPWEEPRLIRKAKGWIDPCPFWDSDGSAYIVHAWARSRAGFNSILTLNRMNAEGTEIVDDGITIFDGTGRQPTIEGPKVYFREGYYYIFAPAGGVKRGWQTVLRSRAIQGPYEERIVMEQGRTDVNGPHQGGWVELPSGEGWFLHFQDRGAYGRIVHLQPLTWVDGWPVIGSDEDGDGKGEPVARYRKPASRGSTPVQVPQTSDEFDSGRPGLQWQWSANPSAEWTAPAEAGMLHLAAVPLPPGARNLRDAGNLLLQKLNAPRFSAIARVTPRFMRDGAQGGVVVMGGAYATLALSKSGGGMRLVQSVAMDARDGGEEIEQQSIEVPEGSLLLRVDIADSAVCSFSYSTDGKMFAGIGKTFLAQGEVWIGAKVGLYCVGPPGPGGEDGLDVDWFHIEPLR